MNQSRMRMTNVTTAQSPFLPEDDDDEHEMEPQSSENGSLIVDNASIQRMKELENQLLQHHHQQQQQQQQQQGLRQRQRWHRLPQLTWSSSSSSSSSSVSSIDSDSCRNSEPTSLSSLESSWRRCRCRGCYCCYCCFGDIPVTTILPCLVFLDMLAVGLVVPLLFQYYQSAGVTSAGQRELLSAVFSIAQIVGGLFLGALIDATWVKRKTVLYLSFGGSAVAYALIAHGGLSALIASRILVGLVKQTMTITKTMMTRATTEESRAIHLGRLSASATLAWVVGPSMGAILFKYCDPRAPPILASAIFVVNLVLAALFLPTDDDDDENDTMIKHNPKSRPTIQQHNANAKAKEKESLPSCRPEKLKTETCEVTPKNCQTCTISFVSNLKTCFSSYTLGTVVCASLVVTWVTRATNSNNLSSFYEDLYGLEPHQRGYISSYQQILGFFIEYSFIAPVLRWTGGERRATCFAAFSLAIAIALHSCHKASLPLFLGLVCPVTSLAYAVMFASLQTLVTTVAPMDSIFSVLAAIDVLQNAVSVTVPFYRTILFAKLTTLETTIHAMTTLISISPEEVMIAGDPDPGSWLLSCTLHWFIAAAALVMCLLLSERQWHNKTNLIQRTPKKTSCR
jgi:MFS family permease